jgi:spore coat protein CotH
MDFIQIIEVQADDVETVLKLQNEYRQATEGKSTIRREILTRDRHDPSHLFNLVFFDSYESAMENSALAETAAISDDFKSVVRGPVTFHDLDVVRDWP